MQWFAMSKRMLLIVSPFLAIVAVLVWLAVVSMDILAAVAHTSKAKPVVEEPEGSVFHLIRFAATGSESDFISYRNAIMVPKGSRAARVELESPVRINSIVRTGFTKAEPPGRHPGC